jgi:hypothetical protein
MRRGGQRALLAAGVLAAWFPGAAPGGTAPAVPAPPEPQDPGPGPCRYAPAADRGSVVPGLVIGAEALLPTGHEPDYGVHIRFNGVIGATGPFDAVRAAYPEAAVLDCRGEGVLSPGFVNAHEHPAYSYSFPDPNLNPGYAHRDEWRLGTGGAVPLANPERYDAEGGEHQRAALVAMELRHLLGGTTLLAGSGGAPGVIRNVGLQERTGDLALYDAEADVSTFPFSFQVVEDLRQECAGGPAHEFPPADDGNLTFLAYVPHVGEGRRSSCAARREVELYLERAARRDRRYSLVHGVATDREDYRRMRDLDVTLVWSPRSNLALYGETVDIAGALDANVRIALSTDWSPSGSFTMKEEVRCAARVAAEAGAALSSESLWRMATANGAYALGLEDRFGAVAPGRAADLMLVRAANGDPYRAVLEAGGDDILAAWIGGRATLLAPTLDDALSERECVVVDGVAPRVCGVLAAAGLSPAAFPRLIEDTVPLSGTARQARCGRPG